MDIGIGYGGPSALRRYLQPSGLRNVSARPVLLSTFLFAKDHCILFFIVVECVLFSF